MLDEIKFNTRSSQYTDKDYIWFGREPDLSWSDKYRNLFFKDENDVNLFVEIEQNNYRVYLYCINFEDRTDTLGRPIYCQLSAEGQRGSESAKFLSKLVKQYVMDPSVLSSKFASALPIDFIENQYDNELSDSAIQAQLETIRWEEIECGDESLLKPNQFVFDYYYDNNDKECHTYNNKLAFCKVVERIASNENVDKTISLILTQEDIEEKYFSEFDYRSFNFSQGLCLSSSEHSDQLPIVKCINYELQCSEGIECSKVFASPDDIIRVSVKKAPVGCLYDIYANGNKISDSFTITELKLEDPQVIKITKKEKLIKYPVYVDGVNKGDVTIHTLKYPIKFNEKLGYNFVGYSVNGISRKTSIKDTELNIVDDNIINENTTKIEVVSNYEKILYSITCDGNCRADKEKAYYKDRITVSCLFQEPIGSITINGNPQPVLNKTTDSFSFEMPADNVSICITPKKALAQIVINQIITIWEKMMEWIKDHKVATISIMIILLLIGLILLIL